MRIALICPYHMFRGGGVQEHVKELQKEYQRRGHYVKIITPLPRDYKGEVPDSIIALGVSMSTKAFAGTSWQWSVSVDTDAIDDVLEREQFDIMHFHEPWIPFWSRQIVMRSKAPKVATMHGRFFDTMTAKTVTSVVTPYTKPMIKYFDVFTAVAEPTTEYFRTLSHRPVVIVPNGIDIKKFKKPRAHKLHRPKGPKTILYLGRLEHRKGVKYLLRAYADLAKKHEDIRLLIAGTGVDENKLKNMVSEESIPNVEFLGFVSDEEKLRLLHEADLFCAPAHYGESFGIVLLEAMAAGCPTVAGDNVGYQSVMTGRGALSLVNPQDTVDFARRLELMLFDNELRGLWLKWAAGHIVQFDWPKVADEYLSIYKQAINRHEQHKKA